MYLEYASPTYFQKMPTHYRMSRNLPSECAPNAGIRPISNYSMQLFDIAELSERWLYLDLCTIFKIVHGLFNLPLAFLILTQAELKVLMNSFCFIDSLPALANYTCTSITRCPSYSCLFSSTTIYCRYLHHPTSSKMFTLHNAERNCKECVTLRKGVQGSTFCYIM